MHQIKALGFDLFNTLLIAEKSALNEAVARLAHSLNHNGLSLDWDVFDQVHRQTALRFIAETRKDWRETHNRFWISDALKTLGYDIPPEDPIIHGAVEAYFSAFYEYCHLIPGTLDMLATVQGAFRLGLLSNFTHAPAALRLIDHLGLSPFFQVRLISGELGYRKPHPMVFQRLVRDLGVEKSEILYIGDDPEPDILGALQAGLRPVWMTYTHDKHIPFSAALSTDRLLEVKDEIPRISTWQDLLTLLGQRT
jgi:HAD superfamily hydrolase (TIGR01549 family)